MVAKTKVAQEAAPEIETIPQIKAIARYIRMSPYKVRRVLDQIRGRSYQEALIILQFMPYRACIPIRQVLLSAAANAEHNNQLDKTELIISQAFADGGPTLKRFRPRAQGRAYQIRKPTCHITIAVSPAPSPKYVSQKPTNNKQET